MAIQDILRLVPTIHAAQLAKMNVDALEKKDTSTRDILSLGVKNIVGVNLIKVESSLIAGL